MKKHNGWVLHTALIEIFWKNNKALKVRINGAEFLANVKKVPATTDVSKKVLDQAIKVAKKHLGAHESPHFGSNCTHCRVVAALENLTIK